MHLAWRHRLCLPFPLHLKLCGPSPMRRARRRLRRPCLGLPSQWALSCQDRRTSTGETPARSRWGKSSGGPGPAAVALHHHAPGVAPNNKRRLGLMIYGASPLGGALCRDATRVAADQPQPGTAAHDGAVLRVAERRKRAVYPKLSSGGPLEQSSAAACQRPGAHSSPSGPAGTASSSHFRLDGMMVGDSGRTSAAGREQHGTRKSVSRTPTRGPAPGHKPKPLLDLAEAAGPSRLPLR